MSALEMRDAWPDARRFQPRAYEEAPMGALVSGAYLHHVWVMNRRAGKDKTALNATIEMVLQRVGNYVHVFPTLVEGRLNLWENIDASGMPVLDHFPRDLLDGDPNQQLMRVRFRNGSTWRVGGANRPDSWRGGNPVGIVWSEYALMKPSVRLIADPILRENGGWEVYVYTPKGANHGRDLYEMASANPDWYTLLLTNRDTQTYSEQDIEKMRSSGIPDEWIQQEIFCSFAAAMVGSYYGRLIEQAERDGRVGKVPWNPHLPVDTAWDIGIGADDATGVWFIQTDGPWFNALEYIETQGDGLPEWVRILRDKPYVYGRHYAPHDMYHHEWGLGRQAGTRADVAQGLGVKYTRAPGPRSFGHGQYVAEGIEAVRRLLPRMRFDETGCKEGLDALKSYRRAEDEARSKGTGAPFFRSEPVHDWASHAADGLRYFAISTPHVPKPKPGDVVPADADFLTQLAAADARRSRGHIPNWKRR